LSTTKLFFLEITSDMSNLARVSDFILDVAKQAHLTEKQTDHVQMALDEAVTNVMEHAYGGRSDGRISIKCRVDARELFLEIRDQGEPFDPRTIKKPDLKKPLSERTIGGLGVFFMRKLMDKVEFSRDAAGNITRMTKKLK
jgi:serine/threonine-protein kinase RsbW